MEQHDWLHLAAAVVLLASGIPLLVLSSRRKLPGRRSQNETPVDVGRRALIAALRAPAVALLAGAGAVHLQAALDHVDEGLIASAFLALALVQFACAAAVSRRDGVITRLTVVSVSTAAVAIWWWSRTIGIPFLAGQPEPIGRSDVVASALEIAVIVDLAAMSAVRALPHRALRDLGSFASAVPIALIGLILIATLLAFAPSNVSHEEHSHHGRVVPVIEQGSAESAARRDATGSEPPQSASIAWVRVRAIPVCPAERGRPSASWS